MKVLFFFSLIIVLTSCKENSSYQTWEVRGGDKAQSRYSEHAQIDTSNVTSLEVAWTYQTNDADDRSQIQTNPIIVDNVLFGLSPSLKAFALDAATGEEKWSFDPFANSDENAPSFNISRGLTYWKGGEEDSRILFSAGSFLYALNPRTGETIKSFGDKGKISLKKGFSEEYKNFFAVATSPGIIYHDLIIMGSRVSE